MVSYFHRGKALRLINEAMNDPELCTSNENIAAIIALASFEVTNTIIECKNVDLGR